MLVLEPVLSCLTEYHNILSRIIIIWITYRNLVDRCPNFDLVLRSQTRLLPVSGRSIERESGNRLALVTHLSVGFLAQLRSYAPPFMHNLYARDRDASYHRCDMHPRPVASVRALASIAQVSTQRTLHCAIIHVARNVQRKYRSI